MLTHTGRCQTSSSDILAAPQEEVWGPAPLDAQTCRSQINAADTCCKTWGGGGGDWHLWGGGEGFGSCDFKQVVPLYVIHMYGA